MTRPSSRTSGRWTFNWTAAAGEFLLHHAVGSPADGNDYRPMETALKPGITKRIAAAGAGRPIPTGPTSTWNGLAKD
jgi:hypothetical protein